MNLTMVFFEFLTCYCSGSYAVCIVGYCMLECKKSCSGFVSNCGFEIDVDLACLW